MIMGQGIDDATGVLGSAGGSSPATVDLRALLPPIRDQGQRGTCIAFAVTAAHETARIGLSGGIEDLAEEILYWGCKQLDRNQSSGTVFTSAAGALQRWGQPLEELWPYDGYRDDSVPYYRPPAGALDLSNCRRASLRRVKNGAHEIKRFLTANQVVVLGIMISHGFLQPVKGRIPMPAPQAGFLGGHAVVAVGYQDATVPNKGSLIIRNSWGNDWGDNGYGYLPYAYIQDVRSEAWVVDSLRPDTSVY